MPRLWTPPLRDLTEDTTYGYEFIDFCRAVGWPLLPWQEWLAIHMGELLPDGRPRFRILLVLVARQQGKTIFGRLLTLWWLFVAECQLVLGSHTSRDKAKQSWAATVEMARSIPLLARELGRRPVTLQVGEEDFVTLAGAHYRFGATNRRLGRGDTVHRNILDELREHKDMSAYDAAVYAMTAVPDGQALAITNQGDARSVVLDFLRDDALAFLETGTGVTDLFLAEWSAPNGADPLDLQALAQANPDLGGRTHPDVLLGQARKAVRAGGAALAGFKTEVMCQRVTLLDPAIDPDFWRECGYDPDDPDTPGVDLARHRGQLALCMDVALDGSHATLMAAATVDGLTWLEVVATWQGFGCTAALRRDLPRLVRKLRPRVFGWFPGGPAAAIAAALSGAARVDGERWPPPRVTVEELKAETVPVCMGLAEQVGTLEIRHPRDPVLSGHVEQTQKLNRGDGWIFTRRGSRPIDATYAAAGAAHLARTLPPPLPPLQSA